MARHGGVEVAGLDTDDDGVELALDELELDAEFGADGLGQVIVETGELVGVADEHLPRRVRSVATDFDRGALVLVRDESRCGFVDLDAGDDRVDVVSGRRGGRVGARSSGGVRARRGGRGGRGAAASGYPCRCEDQHEHEQRNGNDRSLLQNYPTSWDLPAGRSGRGRLDVPDSALQALPDSELIPREPSGFHFLRQKGLRDGFPQVYSEDNGFPY